MEWIRTHVQHINHMEAYVAATHTHTPPGLRAGRALQQIAVNHLLPITESGLPVVGVVRISSKSPTFVFQRKEVYWTYTGNNIIPNYT